MAPHASIDAAVASAAIRGPSLTTAGSLTPTLDDAMRALRSKKGMVKVKDELAKLAGFVTSDGNDLPDEATLDVLEVRRRFLVIAFLRFTSVAFDPSDGSGRSIRAIFATTGDRDQPQIRLAGESWLPHADLDVEFFDGRPRVAIPAIATTVPVIEVYYDHEARAGETESGKKLEILHLATGNRIGDAIALDTYASVPGQSRAQLGAIAWLASKTPGTALLAITRVDTETIWPCTGSPGDRSPACRTQYRCSRSTRVFAVTADAADEDRDVAALRKTEPALGKLPPDASAESELACRKLATR